MKNVLLVIAMFVIALVIFSTGFGVHGTRVYDCGMAEWHPDIPNAVKEECRRIRYEEWKKMQEEKNKNKSLVI